MGVTSQFIQHDKGNVKVKPTGQFGLSVQSSKYLFYIGMLLYRHVVLYRHVGFLFSSFPTLALTMHI